MAKIYVDGKPYEVDPGQNLLHACLGLGLDLPYFCWHPEFGSVGACRQCAVKQFKDEDDTQGKIVMACMTPATDGTRISIDDPEVRAFRASVIEWLMVNHPHDCPVCDEGGECHLQDMTTMTGHVYRRYRGAKRTCRNQDLGPLVNHEMNRCIQCYRCVRFYNDFAGGHDFGAHRLRNQVYFGRHSDGVLENEFSGNLVEVCPTGVFTDKTLAQHYTRKWDLRTAPSVCVHCSIGCNTIPGERYGVLRRIRNRYHSEVNRYFLCDRGRYGYEFVNDDTRIRAPLVATGEVSRETAIARAARMVTESAGVIGIGSPRASVESNFALRQFVGHENFYAGVSDSDLELTATAIDILRKGPARAASLLDCMHADAVLVLGEDPTNTAPMLALALRQSVRNQPMELARRQKIPDWQDAAIRETLQDHKGPFYIAWPAATKLDDIATQVFRGAPADIARLGTAIAGDLVPSSPAAGDIAAPMHGLARQIAGDLRAARRPLIVAGTSIGSKPVLLAAANLARALAQPGRIPAISFVFPECNSFGLGLMAAGPLTQALERMKSGAETILILENDLYARADAALVDDLLARAKHVIALDSNRNRTTEKAELVLPAATFAEATGTYVNYESRAQRAYQVFPSRGAIEESWVWLRAILNSWQGDGVKTWQDLDELTATLARELPVFHPLTGIAPPADFRIAGQKIAREPHRYSGRTAITADVNVNEPKPPDDPDTPLSFTMEGFQGQPPASLLHWFWAPGWNSIQSLNKFQTEIGGPLRGGDPGRCLIEPAAGTQPPSAGTLPAAFQRRPGEFLVVPLYHIFGSEELSRLSAPVAELSPRPYVALNPDDARSLSVSEGEEVTIDREGRVQTLPLRVAPSLVPGTAGIAMTSSQPRERLVSSWVTIAKRQPGM